MCKIGVNYLLRLQINYVKEEHDKKTGGEHSCFINIKKKRRKLTGFLVAVLTNPLCIPIW